MTNSLRMQERIRLALQVDDIDGLSPKVDSARLSFSDEVPFMLSRSLRSASSSSLFKESAMAPDDNGSLHKESFEEEQDIAAELEAAKSLLEMYKQRSGDLVHLIEDVRNQLMALQIENATLKIENEELKKSNEVLIKANQAQPKASDNSSPAGQAEQNPTDN
jgi:dynactin complex subunit